MSFLISRIFPSFKQSIPNKDIGLIDLLPIEIKEAREAYRVWHKYPQEGGDKNYYRDKYIKQIAKIEEIFKIEGSTFKKYSKIYLKQAESYKENPEYQEIAIAFLQKFEEFNQLINQESITSREIETQLRALVKAQDNFSKALFDH